jgi:cytochrome b561
MALTARYSRFAALLHWLVALLILGNIVLGHVMEGAPPIRKPVLVPLHAQIGLTVLGLAAIRLAWRLTHPKPAYPLDLPIRDRLLAGIVQALFYGLMFGLPIVGYLILSANPPNPHRVLSLYGAIQVPFWESLQTMDRAHQKPAHDQLVALHAIGGWMMVGAFALHMLGLLKHLFVDRVNLIGRMSLRKPAAD